MSYYGVGYFINTSYKTDKQAFSVWQGMLKRCYDKKHIRSEAYKGVEVSERWHCFDYFLEDLSKIEGWDEELFYAKKLQLDKDIKGGKLYSVDNCVWLTKEENNSVQPSHMRMFKATTPLGEELIYSNQHKCARDNSLSLSKINECLHGKRKTHKGWRFEFL